MSAPGNRIPGTQARESSPAPRSEFTTGSEVFMAARMRLSAPEPGDLSAENPVSRQTNASKYSAGMEHILWVPASVVEQYKTAAGT